MGRDCWKASVEFIFITLGCELFLKKIEVFIKRLVLSHPQRANGHCDDQNRKITRVHGLAPDFKSEDSQTYCICGKSGIFIPLSYPRAEFFKSGILDVSLLAVTVVEVHRWRVSAQLNCASLNLHEEFVTNSKCQVDIWRLLNFISMLRRRFCFFGSFVLELLPNCYHVYTHILKLMFHCSTGTLNCRCSGPGMPVWLISEVATAHLSTLMKPFIKKANKMWPWPNNLLKRSLICNRPDKNIQINALTPVTYKRRTNGNAVLLTFQSHLRTNCYGRTAAICHFHFVRASFQTASADETFGDMCTLHLVVIFVIS